MNYATSRKMQKRAHQLIPGGSMTYSKGDDQYPQQSPGFIKTARGAYCWDVDGNKFLDWAMGLRTTTLGHGYKKIVDAVKRELVHGANYTRPGVRELELAELFHELIPCAEMVKFNKNGSSTTSAAVRLSRAYTGRDIVAMPENSYNGSDDWSIATSVVNAGVPKAIKDLTVTFRYNDIASVREMFKKYPKKIAAVILEPVNEFAPKDNFLKKLQTECKKNKTVLVFDEMISGFRVHVRGAQYAEKVTPDLACFGKAIANGFSLSALAGKKEIMSLGGLYTDKPRVFLLSSTHGAETHALVAAMETIKELKRKNVSAHIEKIGQRLKKELNAIAKKHGLAEVVSIFGDYGCRLAMLCKESGGYEAIKIRTYMYQEMIAQGVLFNGYFSGSYSHGAKEVAITAKAWDVACGNLKKAIATKTLEKKLVGPTVRPVFRKYN